MKLAIIDCCSHEAYYFGDSYVCCGCITTYSLGPHEKPYFCDEIYPEYIIKDEFERVCFVYKKISHWSLCITIENPPFYTNIEINRKKIDKVVGKWVEGLCTTAS